MMSTKVTFYDVSWRHCYRTLHKETEGLEKVEFDKRMHCQRDDFVCGVIAVAAVKINKMAERQISWEGKQGECLLIFSNNDCIIK